MVPEIEAKFLDIDIDATRELLARAGAMCVHPMRPMRRALVETSAMKPHNAFLRLRDEGDRVTLTYKQHLSTGVHAANEIETTVGDFDTTKAIIEACGLTFHTYQESRRETWRLDGVEVVIDEWPWMPPYIEIEGVSEVAVRGVTERLGFVWSDAVFGGADVIYAQLYTFASGVRGVIDVPEVRFDAPLPAVFSPKGS